MVSNYFFESFFVNLEAELESGAEFRIGPFDSVELSSKCHLNSVAQVLKKITVKFCRFFKEAVLGSRYFTYRNVGKINSSRNTSFDGEVGSRCKGFFNSNREVTVSASGLPASSSGDSSGGVNLKGS